MKKRSFLLRILCVLVVCVLAIPMGGSAYAAAETVYPVSPAEMTAMLTDFLGGSETTRKDRTPFTEGEKNAAAWIKDRFAAFGGYDIQADQQFTVYDNQKNEYFSQNLIMRWASKSAPDESRKRVILGANYDNSFGSPTGGKGTSSHGALENGTGVATLLAIAKHIAEEQPDFGFDVVFVFFGAGASGNLGSQAFVEKMGDSEAANTLLMFNLHRLGGDKSYLYTDEVKTEHETFLMNVASQSGLSVHSVPRGKAIINARYVTNVPYAHWAMLGDHAPFLGRVNVANLYGANLGTMNLGDIESKGNKNLSDTERDTLDNLTATYPDYNVKMAEAAALILGSLSNPDFAAAMASSAQNAYDYGWLNKPVVAYIVLFAVIIALAVCLILLVKHFEKKYPYVPKVKRLKIAVFGMDYEEKNDTDIFVDIKPNNNPRNPFDGY